MRSREENFAIFIIDNNETIRGCAKYFKISKSTVHNDISKKLPLIDMRLFERVDKVMKKNFREKHIRGGEATRRKYEICK